jgi:hypothetical protein
MYHGRWGERCALFRGLVISSAEVIETLGTRAERAFGGSHRGPHWLWTGLFFYFWRFVAASGRRMSIAPRAGSHTSFLQET